MAREFTNNTANRIALSDQTSVGDYTLLFWGKATANSLTHAFVAADNYPTTPRQGLIIYQQRVSAPCVEAYVGDTGNLTDFSSAASTDWAHYGATRSGTTIQPYLNGATTASSFTVGSGSQTLSNVRIGTHYYSGVENQPCNGHVADLAFWDAALTAAEIDAVYSGCSPLSVRPASLRFYLPLVGRTSPEVDLLGANTGTISGTVAASAHPRVIRRRPVLWRPNAAAAAGSITGPLIGGSHLLTNGPLINGRLAA